MAVIHIYDAVRTPRGRGKPGGGLYPVRPVDLAVTTLRAVVERNHLASARVDDVLLGCVTQAGEQGSCIARTAALLAGYDQRVPGVTLNRFCGSGLEAVTQAAGAIHAGCGEVMVAGGVESMSRVPMLSEGGALWEPRSQWAHGVVPQGVSADLLATLDGITREEVDAFALQSQRRALQAVAGGAFARSLVPVADVAGGTILAVEEGPRPEVTADKLSALKPSFAGLGRAGLDDVARRAYPHVEAVNHVHTAGNSSALADGAAVVLLAEAGVGHSLGLKPRARLVSWAVVGDEPVLMLTGPVPATRLALKRAGMQPGDVDLWEINEAFAAVPLHVMRAFGLDPGRVNLHGGSIAFGHPLGATGAMLVGTVLDALEERGLGVGLVTLCVAGGMGIAAVIERVGGA
jgi:acetyl-CoA C-acetyltransferase